MSLQGQYVAEGFVDIDGGCFYAIPDVDRMPAFLMSIVSDADHWMFVSSTGGLTAGRGDATKALFAYQTDDRLHRASGITGPATAIRVNGRGWEPFARLIPADVSRNLYKSVVGDEVIFEEIHHELGIRFRYRWSTSERFGFVRMSTLTNLGDEGVSIDVVDGLVDLLPAGLAPSLYESMSNLTNAYKRGELVDPETRLAAYTLESRISDRPEPAEALQATVAWSAGMSKATVTIDSAAIDSALLDRPVETTRKVTGRPGAFLLSASLMVAQGESRSWHIVTDVDRSQSEVAGLRKFLRTSPDVGAEITDSVQRGTDRFVEMMAGSDAAQQTGDRMATAHHFANVVYNVMRGGTFTHGYEIETADFVSFVQARNRSAAERHSDRLDHLSTWAKRHDLLALAEASDDPQFLRLTLEYLPLGFSRRHGDPSRPWNTFSIRARTAAGDMIRYYEGNWRDIFQNWEALCLSFPQYLPSVIALFVNASTIDGYNPYRITRNGIDWEVPEPDNPWSNIGYWGDHQIVYLLRLLDLAKRYLPGQIEEFIDRSCFSYADVPYRIVSYEEIKRDPKQTIIYDATADEQITARAASRGADGRLLHADGDVHLVNLIEKLVVPALSKLSNFVPGGGIWMNTQRPEWNDGNNALVGNGLSFVTLYYLRRYLHHLDELVTSLSLGEVTMSTDVAEWLYEITAILRDHAPEPRRPIEGRTRLVVMDRLGEAFTTYRSAVYRSGFSGKTAVAVSAIVDLCRAGLAHLDDTIRAGRRADGLFHSYNVLRLSDQSAAVDHLDEMLEGQVAVLSSGLLSAAEIVEVLDALFASKMYRPDQNSFMLYPTREPPSFMEKNVVPERLVANNALFTALLEAGETSIVGRDADGNIRFNGDFENRRDVEGALVSLSDAGPWQTLVALHRQQTLDTYEEVFRHREFTGRSGAMYGYEGIGSIYWHMVAKLLVAVQEAVVDAHNAGASPEARGRLVDYYWRVRAGLGFNKTAAGYGAFPTDPYSHTPAHAGAQQPGMTGQVKEEIITRSGELGVRVSEGALRFEPLLLRRNEFLPESTLWRVHHVAGDEEDLTLPANSLGFTVCGVPVIYRLTAAEPTVTSVLANGQSAVIPGNRLGEEVSQLVFQRTGDIRLIEVAVPESALTQEGT